MAYSEEQIKKAAKIIKIIRLSGTPGMDVVSIRLNANPTWDEIEVAKKYAKAFEEATTDISPYAAAELVNGGPL